MKFVCLLIFLTLTSHVLSTRFRAAPTKGCKDLKTDATCKKDQKCEWDKVKKCQDKKATAAKKKLFEAETETETETETDSEGVPAKGKPAAVQCDKFKTQKECPKECDFVKNKCAAKAAAKKKLFEAETETETDSEGAPAKGKPAAVQCDKFKTQKECPKECNFVKNKCAAKAAAAVVKKKLFEAETETETDSEGVPAKGKPAAVQCDKFKTQKECPKECDFKKNKCAAKAAAPVVKKKLFEAETETETDSEGVPAKGKPAAVQCDKFKTQKECPKECDFVKNKCAAKVAAKKK